jgi:hypothetical protein
LPTPLTRKSEAHTRVYSPAGSLTTNGLKVVTSFHVPLGTALDCRVVGRGARDHDLGLVKLPRGQTEGGGSRRVILRKHDILILVLQPSTSRKYSGLTSAKLPALIV